MRVPSLLAAVAITAACATPPPPAASPPLQTSALQTPVIGGGATFTPVPPMSPPAVLPAQPPVAFLPWIGWPGSSLGLPGWGNTIYELTRFDGPESTMPGPRTLMASGGEYDSCANDYEATASLQSGAMEIRLSVTVKPANRQCFASGYEKTHTFEFPLRLDAPGTYRVLGQTARGDYRALGSVVVQDGTVDPGTGNGQFVYEFTHFDGPQTAQSGVPVTVKASGETYPFCDYTFTDHAHVDAQAHTLDLSLIGTPLPPDRPHCMALGVSHTHEFDVTFPQSGLYTVRTQREDGWQTIGAIGVN